MAKKIIAGDKILVEATRDSLIDLGIHDNDTLHWLLIDKPKTIHKIEGHKIVFLDSPVPLTWVHKSMIYRSPV